jgi:hypothetical protein
MNAPTIWVRVTATKEEGRVVEFPDSGSIKVHFRNQSTREYDVSELRYLGEPGVDCPYMDDYEW